MVVDLSAREEIGFNTCAMWGQIAPLLSNRSFAWGLTAYRRFEAKADFGQMGIRRPSDLSGEPEMSCLIEIPADSNVCFRSIPVIVKHSTAIGRVNLTKVELREYPSHQMSLVFRRVELRALCSLAHKIFPNPAAPQIQTFLELRSPFHSVALSISATSIIFSSFATEVPF
jgi:hypothetical protein